MLGKQAIYRRVVIALTLVFSVAGMLFGVRLARAQESPIYSRKARFHPTVAEHGMVATQEAEATRAGLAVLKEGGNAVDAAVTVGFTLAVTLPRAGNLGGGGFMMIHLADESRTLALDYREKAPKAAHKEMFLDDAGEASPKKSRHSYLAVGVPGTVRGLTRALKEFGTISLERALRPAIRMAEEGFPVTHGLHRALTQARDRMKASPAAMEVFFKPNGEPYAVGETLKQTDLAKSLRSIAREGAAAFYDGWIGEKLVEVMRANDGLLTKEDLQAYDTVIRKPIRGTFRGYEILSMPPPSSGGVHIVQMLNILKSHNLAGMGHNSADYIHLLAETMKRAYADRSRHLGDTDFEPVPIADLTSEAYAEHLRRQIDMKTATPSTEIEPGSPRGFPEGRNTTHFSIVDQWGNAVANTYTLNFSFGSKRMIPGTGILLNNEMDDFSAKPGAPNAYGLIGGERNAVEPEKRMLSSMSPTIVLEDGDIALVTGSPGGSRIITTVLQILLNALEHDMNIAEATAAPRAHHQWLPDELRLERGISPDTMDLLRQKGHTPVVKQAMGCTQSIRAKDGHFYGYSDPRRTGGLTLGY